MSSPINYYFGSIFKPELKLDTVAREPEVKQVNSLQGDPWIAAFQGQEEKVNRAQKKIQQHWLNLESCQLHVYIDPEKGELGFHGHDLGAHSDTYLSGETFYYRTYISFKIKDRIEMNDLPRIWELLTSQEYTSPKAAIKSITAYLEAKQITKGDPVKSPDDFNSGETIEDDWQKKAFLMTGEFTPEEIRVGMDRRKLFRTLDELEKSEFVTRKMLVPAYHISSRLLKDQRFSKTDELEVQRRLRALKDKSAEKPGLSSEEKVELLKLEMVEFSEKFPVELLPNAASVEVHAQLPSVVDDVGSKEIEVEKNRKPKAVEVPAVDNIFVLKEKISSSKSFVEGLNDLKEQLLKVRDLSEAVKLLRAIPSMEAPIWVELRKASQSDVLNNLRVIIDHVVSLDNTNNNKEILAVVTAIISYPISLFSYFSDKAECSDEEIRQFKITHFTPFIAGISAVVNFDDPLLALQAEEIARGYFNALGLESSRTLLDCLEDKKVQKIIEDWKILLDKKGELANKNMKQYEELIKQFIQQEPDFAKDFSNGLLARGLFNATRAKVRVALEKVVTSKLSNVTSEEDRNTLPEKWRKFAGNTEVLIAELNKYIDSKCRDSTEKYISEVLNELESKMCAYAEIKKNEASNPKELKSAAQQITLKMSSIKLISGCVDFKGWQDWGEQQVKSSVDRKKVNVMLPPPPFA